jgi:hypothetical protein
MLEEQYKLAKKYLGHGLEQAKLSQKMAELKLKANTRRVSEHAADAIASVDYQVRDNDWTECYDPRTKRKYYYSKSRKTSSWVKPQQDAFNWSHNPKNDAPATSNNTTNNTSNNTTNHTATNNYTSNHTGTATTTTTTTHMPAADAASVASHRSGNTRGSSPSRADGNGNNNSNSNSNNNSNIHSNSNSPITNILREGKTSSPVAAAGAAGTGTGAAGTGTGAGAGAMSSSGRSVSSKEARPEWRRVKDESSGRDYWYNRHTRETTWFDPYKGK